jgi:hypothetical protein
VGLVFLQLGDRLLLQLKLRRRVREGVVLCFQLAFAPLPLLFQVFHLRIITLIIHHD